MCETCPSKRAKSNNLLETAMAALLDAKLSEKQREDIVRGCIELAKPEDRSVFVALSPMVKNTNQRGSKVIDAFEVVKAFLNEHPELIKEPPKLTQPPRTITVEEAATTVSAYLKARPEASDESKRAFADAVITRVARTKLFRLLEKK